MHAHALGKLLAREPATELQAQGLNSIGQHLDLGLHGFSWRHVVFLVRFLMMLASS